MSEKEQLLSSNQVDQVMEFAEALYAIDSYGFYSPWLQNNLLQNLTNSAKTATFDSIKKALADYRNNGENLQDYTEFMQRWSFLFNRTLSYYADILSFDLEVVAGDDYTAEDYKSAEYAEDKKRVYRFLSSFDYQAEFNKVVKALLTHETYYTWFRKTKWGNKGLKYALQVMPQRYCMLTGYWEKGLMYSFDMNYFLQAGVDIDGFDPAFKKYFNNVFGEGGANHPYLPTAPIGEREGVYATWTQTDPNEGAWAFKMDTSNFNATPMIAPLLKSAIRTEELAELQYNKDIAGAYAILAGELRLIQKQDIGNQHDQFAIDPKKVGQFMRQVKNGLPSQFRVAAMPTENTDLYQLQDHNVNAYSNQIKSNAGLGASASRLLYADDRMSNAELENAIQNDYNMMRSLYSQFSNFLEFYANKVTKKYKFGFIFNGSNYIFERDKRIERLIKYADKGIVLNSSAFASAIGMKPQDFDRSLAEGHNDPNFLSNLSMLMNAHTMRDGSAGGRPPAERSDLTDSGEDSQMYS